MQRKDFQEVKSKIKFGLIVILTSHFYQFRDFDTPIFK
jgi:hypothetical protein